MDVDRALVTIVPHTTGRDSLDSKCRYWYRSLRLTELADGRSAEFAVSWIGRYILGGTVISDEFHSLALDGSPYLGISLRQCDASKKAWVVEYFNVSNSFLRRQVSASVPQECQR